ncbi:glycosyltransferase 61 family protein [Paragemmobacter ruber]|uniref:DUF563 domain-containing protein n=1 Tax=Paragemmobacter ruber TaxID=1985673 RepID=A0ABW9Y7V2_9RHOB|nr:glycosyltransferase family 61 protein [Rhodobacter ruber]NBE08653.1 DUF563 domain-containing protein [Rhodobacter ruber]
MPSLHAARNKPTPPLLRPNLVVAPFVCRLLGNGQPEAEVLHPEEVEAVTPPAMLEGMLDRVTGTDEHSVLAHHISASVETSVRHVAVLRRVHRNALMSRGGFVTWRHKENYDRAWRSVDAGAPLREVALARYCNSYVSWRYFGHWLTDAIPTSLIEPDLGALWMPAHPAWGHAADYRRALDLPTMTEAWVHAEELVTYQDFGQGTHKQRRFDVIRRKLQARFGTGQAGDLVYLRRGRTGAPRWIRDEDRLVDALVARDWKIVDVGTASVAELQQALCRARVVVSIDGSHLDHAHLCLLPGSTMIVLIPQDRYTARQLGLCRAHKVSPGFVVLPGSAEAGYVADLDEVLQTVDLAATA